MRVDFLAVCVILFLVLSHCESPMEPRSLPGDFFSYLNEQSVTLPPDVQQRLNSIKARPASKFVWLIQFHDLKNLLFQQQLRFFLPRVGRVMSIAKRIRQPDSSNVAWSGVLQESKLPMFLMVVNGTVGGMIHTKRDVFRIKPIGAGHHVLIHLDPSKFGLVDPHGSDSNDGQNRKQDAQTPGTGLSKSSAATAITAPPVIDLLVAYTQKAADTSGDIANLIACSELSLNEVLENSGNSARVEVVQSVQVSNPQSGSNNGDFCHQLQDPNDGSWDDIHALRDQYGALLTDDGSSWLGWACEVPAADASEAFAALYQGAAVEYTFAHEVSHLIGARHAYDPKGTYEHARVWLDEHWHTVTSSN